MNYLQPLPAPIRNRVVEAAHHDMVSGCLQNLNGFFEASANDRCSRLHLTLSGLAREKMEIALDLCDEYGIDYSIATAAFHECREAAKQSFEDFMLSPDNPLNKRILR